MKVCVIGTRGFPSIQGGVEKHCESLYPLLNSNIDVTVFRRKAYIKSNVTYKNIKFIDLPSTRIKGLETVLHSFLATLYAIFIRPDIVHIHNIGPAMFSPLLKLFSIQIVLTYHSPNYEHKKWGGIAKAILRACESIALKFSDRIIFVNSFQMQKYSKDIQNKSVYIPNGIEKPAISMNNDYLDEISVTPRKYILGVGRITPEKGFETLIKAYNLMNSCEYKLVVAGGVEVESAYKGQLDALINTENIIFTGYIYGDKLAQLYTNAALFVLASHNEGFPLVLLEAMSYKLDLLVSDIPATHLVELDKEDYFEKGNYEDLSKKMQKKLSLSVAQKYDLSKFDWFEIAKKTSEILSMLENYEQNRINRRS